MCITGKTVEINILLIMHLHYNMHHYELYYTPYNC